MLEILEDTIIDSLKLVPFLFITYIIMELIEIHAGEKTEKAIRKSGKFGPIIGAILGIIPHVEIVICLAPISIPLPLLIISIKFITFS